MICTPCARAADTRAPRDQHCDSTGGPGAACDCQHRVNRYRTLDQRAPVGEFDSFLDRLVGEARAREEHYRRDLPVRAARIAAHLTEQLIPEDLRAVGIHFAYDTTTYDTTTKET